MKLIAGELQADDGEALQRTTTRLRRARAQALRHLSRQRRIGAREAIWRGRA